MVRATRRTLSWARAERPSSVIGGLEDVLTLVVELAELAGLTVRHVGRCGGCRLPVKRAAWHAAGDGHLRRNSSLDVPGVPPESSRNATDGTSMWMSMRSNSGPLILLMYRSICGGVQWQLRRGSPR